MDQQIASTNEVLKKAWDTFSSGWKKWDTRTMEFLRPVGEKIIQKIDPKDHQYILDIASGTGEPGLSIAAAYPGVHVMLSDFSDKMVNISSAKAADKNLKNVSFCVCDAVALPFADHTFDAITCRFGYMYFPNILSAARDMARVLKPGGTLSIAVWGPPANNFWITAIESIINKNTGLPPPVSGAPGMFRCASPNFMVSTLQQVGLKNISVEELNSQLDCHTTEIYWTLMTEVGAPFASILQSTKQDTVMKIKKEVFHLMNSKFPPGHVIMETQALVITAKK